MEIVFDTYHQTRTVYANREKVAFCAYCGNYGVMTKDHIVPLCRGGSGHSRNIAWVCSTCNANKGSLSLREWLHTLSPLSPILRHARRFCAFRFTHFMPPEPSSLTITVDNELCVTP